MTQEQAENLLQERTNEIQQDAHAFVEEMMKHTRASYQDVMNVYLFSKIAALELHIEALTSTRKG